MTISFRNSIRQKCCLTTPPTPRYLGETFNSCTTFDSANGAAWCKDIDGKYRDCAPPCGATVPGESLANYLQQPTN